MTRSPPSAGGEGWGEEAGFSWVSFSSLPANSACGAGLPNRIRQVGQLPSIQADFGVPHTGHRFASLLIKRVSADSSSNSVDCYNFLLWQRFNAPIPTPFTGSAQSASSASPHPLLRACPLFAQSPCATALHSVAVSDAPPRVPRLRS